MRAVRGQLKVPRWRQPATIVIVLSIVSFVLSLVVSHHLFPLMSSNNDEAVYLFQARVFRSDDGGNTWTVSPTPIDSGPTAGIFALAFNGQQHGLAAGGDFLNPSSSPHALASTADGGASWDLVARPPNEYRSGAAWITGRAAIVVGPTGSDVSQDGGQTWNRIDTGSFDTVDCANPNACWASGEAGRAAHLVKTK